MNLETLVKLIILKLENGIPENFSGMGVIIINAENNTLPLAPLLSKEETYKNLTDENAVNLLFDISSINDKRHDGFHLIELENGNLTISLYFSPKIPINFRGTIFNVGSRFRAAQYGSLYNCIEAIIIISQAGKVSIGVVSENGK